MSATITCYCGHIAPVDAFTRGQIPKHFQCPLCRQAWKIHDSPATILPTGYIMPGKRTVIKIGQPIKKESK